MGRSRWLLAGALTLNSPTPVPHASAGAVFDFALYFFHNAKQLLANGNGPYFYL